MKSIFLLAGLLSLIITSSGYSTEYSIQPPPQSMDKFYSERGETSKWIEKMREINKNFQAIIFNIDQKDWQQSLHSSKSFNAAYQKASEMVPEWKKLFDLNSSEDFIKSIEVKDLEKIRQLSEKLKETCSKCHQKHNTSVWVRYQWPLTKTIKVLDPLEDKELTYLQFMHKLSSSFQNITIALDQKKLNHAWRLIDEFSKRLKSLRSVCSKCHVTEWTKNPKSVKEFFVGEDMIDALQEIKKTIASGVPDKKIIQKHTEYISKQSCKMCHLVHQPSANIQRTWASSP